MSPVTETRWEAKKRRRREFLDRQARKKLIQVLEPAYTSEPEIPEPIKRECVFCHWIGWDKSTVVWSDIPARNFRAVPTYKHKDDVICHLCDTQFIPFRKRHYAAQ